MTAFSWDVLISDHPMWLLLAFEFVRLNLTQASPELVGFSMWPPFVPGRKCSRVSGPSEIRNWRLGLLRQQVLQNSKWGSAAHCYPIGKIPEAMFW